MGVQVVTGANRGIGLELAKRLKARGGDVVALVRTPSPELLALGVAVESGIDVARDEGLRAVKERLASASVDLLIHNAGILRDDGVETLLDPDAVEGIRAQLETNALAPLLLTATLLPRMARGSKVVVVSSRMGSLGDNGSGGSYGYRMSKAAANMAGVSLARDLAPRGIAVAILHPGYVRTEMTGYQGNVAPAESARGLVERIDGLSLANSGTFWHANGEVLPW